MDIKSRKKFFVTDFYKEMKNYKNLQYDSRKVEKGDVFVAMVGETVDGHDYIDKAIKNGATGIIISKEIEKREGIKYYLIENIRENIGEIASEFYCYPQKKLKVIGITGTNGKTTTTYILESLLGEKNVARIGTVEYKIGDEIIEAPNTTPEPIDIVKMCKKSVEKGLKYLVMEVSSHGLILGRVNMLEFDVAIFTNLTPDHLDFHKNMEEYYEAKKILFLKTKKNGVKIINTDDIYGKRYFEEFGGKSYGMKDADLVGVFKSENPSEIEINSKKIVTKLMGRYNLYNIMAGVSAGMGLGLNFEELIEKITLIEGVPGRFQMVDCKQEFAAVVDFAHTGDAMENILKTVVEMNFKKIITVFGCGGDRDVKKRSEMAKIAERYSDIVILTTDNPRTENIEKILEDSIKGFETKKYIVKKEREDGIGTAVKLAEKGDIILVLGKGHETYQIVGKTKYHFDDREILCREILKKNKNN
jgi:UDP-N-acetylmuramoyl-L-alanyl-D-glutamate--2,6-diaminopimelate ligase